VARSRLRSGRQQRPAVGSVGLVEVPEPVRLVRGPLRPRGRLLEHGHISLHGLPIQPNGEAVRDEDRARRRARRFQLAAQRRKRDAQTVTPGLERQIGPQQFDECFARVRGGPVFVKREVGEQGARLLGAEPGDRPRGPEQPRAQATQQFDTARWFLQLRALRSCVSGVRHPPWSTTYRPLSLRSRRFSSARAVHSAGGIWFDAGAPVAFGAPLDGFSLEKSILRRRPQNLLAPV
jgi:hypothetical protein